MTGYHLSTGHVRALVALPEDGETTVARAAARTLPGGWTLNEAPAATGPAAIVVTTGQAAVSADAATVRLRLPRTVAASSTLAYTTYTALERLRQQRRKVTIHATAVLRPDGRAVLLLGTKGAGKTSTALALAAHGWTHAGDDLVVIGMADDDHLAVWPGKVTAAIRDPGRPLAPKAQLVLTPFASGPAPLTWIVRLAVHPAVTAKSLTRAVPLTVNEQLRLHEMLARHLSGLPTPLTGVTGAPYGPVWPLDTPALARWRSHLITALADCRFDYLHAPDPGTAADLLTLEANR
ncbi:hypothetical protein ABZW47_17905 [Streptomyces sp. NPDC004549]|uniref:hypothetical protein n=1 Tax=Streptomyces sp. NPDC004549 TaxID=3154283 RepID=UPI0033BA6D7F